MIKPASEALAINYEEDINTVHYTNNGATNYDRTTEALKQCTLKTTVQAAGRGRQGDRPIVITLRPAPIYTGIVFRRTDIKPVKTVETSLAYAKATSLKTSLIKENIAIHDAEHILSALSGLGIDNVYIDVNHDRLPTMDGSAEPFVFLIQSAGVKSQSALKRFIRVKKKYKSALMTHGLW